MKKLFLLAAALVVTGAAGLFFTAPKTTDPADIAGLTPDIAAGEQVFWAAGCASCHSPKDATGAERLLLSGGRAFASDFGTFYAPNISPHPEQGIGSWQAIDLVNAMRHGSSPKGQHYFPVFPYGTYGRAELQDIVSLYAFLKTLPPVPVGNRPHDVGFPFNIRLALGGWKMLFTSDDWVMADTDTPELARGRYLVEALGHCGECHTPRNTLGGLDNSRWLTGAKNPNGQGRIPGITPDKLDWISADIVNYFKTGFTPDFDTAGGHMTDVIENLSQLPADDLQAIAAYLKAWPSP